MLTISYFAGIIGAICIFFFGWMINHFVVQRKRTDWEPKYKESESKLSSLTKKVKNEKLQTEQQKQKAEKWKADYTDLKNTHQSAVSEWEAKNQLHQEEVSKYISSHKTMDNEIKRLQRINDKMDKDLTIQKEKYKTDMEDMKTWKSEKANASREIDNLKSKLSNMKSSVIDYKTKYESQLQEIESVREMQRNLRALKTKLSKAEKDITYWEKKHYDTHHELANLKKKSEGFQNEFLKIEELRKGDEILKSNLVKQIQEFKTKYLDISDKYRTITKKGV